MRSKVLKKLIEETPVETKIFVDLYADLVVRINQLIKEKGYGSQKVLAAKMGKRPSEISKWLSGDHNFTLKSIAKLTAELGEPLIHIPKRHTFSHFKSASVSMTVYKNDRPSLKDGFKEAKRQSSYESYEPVAS